MATRAEHLAWAKARALEYLDRGDTAGAIASMTSDLGKHPDTEELPGRLAPLAVFAIMAGPDEVRRFIEGF